MEGETSWRRENSECRLHSPMEWVGRRRRDSVVLGRDSPKTRNFQQKNLQWVSVNHTYTCLSASLFKTWVNFIPQPFFAAAVLWTPPSPPNWICPDRRTCFGVPTRRREACRLEEGREGGKPTCWRRRKDRMLLHCMQWILHTRNKLFQGKKYRNGMYQEDSCSRGLRFELGYWLQDNCHESY